MAPDNSTAGLVCTQLTKSFGPVAVLKGIDFAVPHGKVTVSYTHLTLPTNREV